MPIDRIVISSQSLYLTVDYIRHITHKPCTRC